MVRASPRTMGCVCCTVLCCTVLLLLLSFESVRCVALRVHDTNVSPFFLSFYYFAVVFAPALALAGFFPFLLFGVAWLGRWLAWAGLGCGVGAHG